MTAGDPLACLKTGLAEDERAALAAMDLPSGIARSWQTVEYDDSRHGRLRTVEDSWGVVLAPELGRLSDHIARHDPDRALNQAKVFGEIVTAYHDLVAARDSRDRHASNDFTAGSDSAGVMWLDWVVQRLASIYAESDAAEQP